MQFHPWCQSTRAPFLIATALVALLAPTGCSDDSDTSTPDDPDSWTVLPEATLSHPEPTGRFRTPRWSPDGKHLAIDGSGGLFISPFPLQGAPTPLINESIYEFAWSPDSRHLAAIDFRTATVTLCDVHRGTITNRINVPGVPFLRDLVWTTGGYLTMSAPTEGTHYFYDADGRAVPEYRIDDPSCARSRFLRGQQYEIWVSDRRHSQERRIVGPGRWFLLTSQSPIARKLVSYTDEIDPSTVLSQLVDYAGTTLFVFPQAFIDSDWTADGRFLVGTQVTGDDDEALSAAEIVIFDPETHQYSIITDTPDVIEWAPSLCVANGRIAYSDNEGRVVIGQIVALNGEGETRRSASLSGP